jgi:hypothetical protein
MSSRGREAIEPLSAAAKQTLVAHRRATRLTAPAKVNLRARIDRSIASGAATQLDAALREPPTQRERSGARGIAVWVALPLAIAAAVLLVVHTFAPEARIRQDAGLGDAAQAAYGAADRDPRLPAARRSTVLGTAQPAAEVSPAVEPLPVAEPLPDVEPLPIRTERAREGSPSTGSRYRPPSSDDAPAPVPTDTTLAAEMRLLRRARSALNDGDPTQALARLTAHAETFAQGQMVEDREALRVQALCEAGRETAARVAATAFLATHPHSPHSARVQRICAER